MYLMCVLCTVYCVVYLMCVERQIVIQLLCAVLMCVDLLKVLVLCGPVNMMKR